MNDYTQGRFAGICQGGCLDGQKVGSSVPKLYGLQTPPPFWVDAPDMGATVTPHLYLWKPVWRNLGKDQFGQTVVDSDGGYWEYQEPKPAASPLTPEGGI